MGIPTTGKSVHFTEVYIRQIENGKLAEGSSLTDTATFLSQLQGARRLGDENHVPLFDPDGGQWLMP